jgi:hypothetical protein
MPATAVNFLNGSDGSSLFDFADARGGALNSTGSDPEDYDSVFVELGCKVYEVNKVHYRGNERRAVEDASSIYNAAL